MRVPTKARLRRLLKSSADRQPVQAAEREVRPSTEKRRDPHPKSKAIWRVRSGADPPFHQDSDITATESPTLEAHLVEGSPLFEVRRPCRLTGASLINNRTAGRASATAQTLARLNILIFENSDPGFKNCIKFYPLENVEAVSRLLLTFDPGSRTKQRETEDMPKPTCCESWRYCTPIAIGSTTRRVRVVKVVGWIGTRWRSACTHKPRVPNASSAMAMYTKYNANKNLLNYNHVCPPALKYRPLRALVIRLRSLSECSLDLLAATSQQEQLRSVNAVEITKLTVPPANLRLADHGTSSDLDFPATSFAKQQSWNSDTSHRPRSFSGPQNVAFEKSSNL
ncbi:unnamed protein product [Trichogramma brassicae]|uniref:Uncharacterized protein n=1 Tax=Trichogramma brassicae TaxID=86971 RepID=A0A6H5IQS1_9HYME|nr:unnamed protein product [Trichogramma brassicae]